jgi:hypothetical protein
VLDSHLFVEAIAIISVDLAPKKYSFPEAVLSG